MFFKGSLKALDKAALFRDSCNASNTSAFNVLHDAIGLESGAESPLVEIYINCSMERLIYFYANMQTGFAVADMCMK